MAGRSGPRAAVVTFAALAAASCHGAKNYEQASYSKQGSGYLIELKGRRYLAAHDPLSAIRGRTYEETYQIEVPRIDGRIDGSEIPVSPGRLKYSGSIEIVQGRMTVRLAYRNTDDTRRDPLSWNGTYALAPKGAPSK